VDIRKPGRCKSSVAAFLVFGSHLVPRFECLLASFDFVLLTDGLLTLAYHVVKLSETHVHVVVAVSGGEGLEHLFKANFGVIVGVNDSEEALCHALPSERLSGDSASLVLLSTTFVILVSRSRVTVVAAATITVVAISSLRVIPSASTGVSSSGILSESAAAFVITELIIILIKIFLIAVGHAQVGLLVLVFIVAVSATTVPGVAVVATITTVSPVSGLLIQVFLILLVLFVLFSLDFGFRSGTDSTERSDLTIHGLEELILLKIVVVVGVHGVVSFGDFSRFDVSVLVDVEEAEDSLGVDSLE